MTTVNKRFWHTVRFTGILLREVIGWILVLAGLNIFRICFGYLNQALVVEGFVAAIMGIVLFRGGLQLVKVAVAARALRIETSREPLREVSPA